MASALPTASIFDTNALSGMRTATKVFLSRGPPPLSSTLLMSKCSTDAQCVMFGESTGSRPVAFCAKCEPFARAYEIESMVDP